MDRFKYIDPKEPKILSYCSNPKCGEAIVEGEEVISIQVEGVMVHSDCFIEYIYYLLECKNCYAGEE